MLYLFLGVNIALPACTDELRTFGVTGLLSVSTNVAFRGFRIQKIHADMDFHGPGLGTGVSRHGESQNQTCQAADKFVAAIEGITSTKKRVLQRQPLNKGRMMFLIQ